LEWILFYKIYFRQDKQDYQDNFCLHQFFEEIDETQFTYGTKPVDSLCQLIPEFCT